MDSRWNQVLKSWLNFSEEVGAIFVSPTHAEVWKGTPSQCPYFKKYQNEDVVVVHTHPTTPTRKYSPPSPSDLINCIESRNPHIVVTQEGFWIYSPTEELQQEWKRLDDVQKGELIKIIVNNSYGLTARLIGGELLETFTESVDRTELNLSQYLENMVFMIPRKDPSLPSLGFTLKLMDTLPTDNLLYNEERQLLGYEWCVENVEALYTAIEEASPESCVTADGSVLAF